MDLNVGKEVAALKRMTVNELRAKHADVFGEETNARHKEWLVRRIAWRIQSPAEGDISERARQRASELANDADLRTSAPKPVRPAQLAVERTRTATAENHARHSSREGSSSIGTPHKTRSSAGKSAGQLEFNAALA